MQQTSRDILDQVWPVIYDELRRVARVQLLAERRDHTLQPTALVHEAYLRLRRERREDCKSQPLFLRAAAQAMRRILVDHARHCGRQKRGGHSLKLTFDDAVFVAEHRAPMLLEIDECLRRLSQMDPRQAQIVELRYFGGLTVEETAEVLGVCSKTVTREWTLAKVWLYGELVTGNAERNEVAKSQDSI